MKQTSYPYPGGLAGTDSVTGVVAGSTSEIPVSEIASFVASGGAGGGNTSALRGPRIALIGDSLHDVGFQEAQALCTGSNPLAPLAGGFVVSGGIATFQGDGVTPTGAQPGNWTKVYNVGDATLSDYVNNLMVKVIDAPNLFNFTFDTRDGNGVPMPDGDYSTRYGRVWATQSLNVLTDMGWFQQLNALLGGQFMITANYAFSGQTSPVTLEFLEKIFSNQPIFDVVGLSLGEADIVFNTTVANAVAAAINAYENILTIIQEINKRGIPVMISTPNMVAAATSLGNAQVANIGVLNLRRALLNLKNSSRSQMVKVVDVMSAICDGTLTTGDLIAGSTLDNYHPSSSGAVAIARSELDNVGLWLPQRRLELEPISILEDATTYPQPGGLYTNLLKNGLMAGTSGTLSANNTGTLPTGWASGSVTGSLVTAGNAARAVTTKANSNKWGFGLNAAWTYTTAGQQFLLASPDFSGEIFAGSWYRFGVQVTGLADAVNLKNLVFAWQLRNGVQLTGQVLNSASVGSNTFDIKNGDTFTFVGPPFFYKAGLAGLINCFAQIQGIAAGAGSCNLQFSNIWVNFIDPPY